MEKCYDFVNNFARVNQKALIIYFIYIAEKLFPRMYTK